MTAIRILTINTGKCDGPYHARLRWLTSELSRLEPDIVALQEAFIAEDGSAHTPGTVAAALGLHLTAARVRFKTRICEGHATPGWSGLALLGREPWAQEDVLHLPTDERDGERIALLGLAAYAGREIVVANTHLSHLPDADTLRRSQLEAVLGHPLLSRPRALRLLCGDLNTTADGPVLAPYLDGSATPRLHDTYLLGGGTNPRGTLPPHRSDAAASDSPCIDFILLVDSDGEDPPSFRASRVTLDRPRPGTTLYPSDHFGVITTIAWEPNPPAPFPRREGGVLSEQG